MGGRVAAPNLSVTIRKNGGLPNQKMLQADKDKQNNNLL